MGKTKEENLVKMVTEALFNAATYLTGDDLLHHWHECAALDHGLCVGDIVQPRPNTLYRDNVSLVVEVYDKPRFEKGDGDQVVTGRIFIALKIDETTILHKTHEVMLSSYEKITDV